VHCTFGCTRGHRDGKVQCISLKGVLITLLIRSESRVQCVALVVALQITGTIGFIVLHLKMHCLNYRSEVTVGFSVLHL